MALRVLLADESSTIKKVMQLALSDFAVEVKSVPVGLDVLSVATTFKPDIVFADVLLAKRSGYEACAELKNNPSTEHIPVVLMWSGFMEIDESKARDCKADERLEKPFDADRLREIVKNLVQKTKSNPISEFLSFPSMPELEEPPSTTPVSAAVEKNDLLEMPEIETIDEEFASVPLTNPRAADDNDEGGWTRQDLTKFKIQVPETENEDFASKFVIPQENDLESVNVEDVGDFEEITFAEPVVAVPKPPPSKVPSKTAPDTKMATPPSPGQIKNLMPERPAQSNAEPKAHSKMDLSHEMMEKVIREEVREVIESICWKVIPEIAERVVREEINKILKDNEL